MYRLIIADDEKIVRENILKAVDFESCGFQVTACCKDGLEVLEKAAAEFPDLVVTDIQMPFMDGITLAQELKKQYSGVRVVFLTGYNDFEYAQKAVSLEAYDYLLKPISREKLTQSLCEIKARLDEQRQMLRDLTRFKDHYEASLPLLRNSFLSELLTMPISQEKIAERAHSLHMEWILSGNLAVAVMQMDPGGSPAEQKMLESYSYAVYNVAEELTQAVPEVFPMFRGSETVLFAVCSQGEEKGMQKLEEALGHISKTIERHLPFTVSVGVSNLCPGPQGLRECYAGALSALDYRVAMGSNQILHISDLEPARGRVLLPDPELEARLHYALKLGGEEELRETLKEVEARAASGPYSSKTVSGYYLSVFLSLEREAAAYEIGESAGDPWQLGRVLEHKDLEEYAAHLEDVCFQIKDRILKKRQSSCNALVDKAINHIREGYGNSELSTSTLSGELAISASYLSAIFKKETGQSVGGYIQEIRMNKARDMLYLTDKKNYEIAEEIGFKDPHYFSYTFKKHFGLSPNEMRKNLRCASETA